MKNEPLLISYLKHRLSVILTAAFMLCLAGMCIIVFGMDHRPFFYMFYVSLVAAFITGCVDLYFFARKRKAVMTGRRFITSDPIEKGLLDTIDTMKEREKEQGTKAAAEYEDMAEYFTTWVHQIKTPISAISLTLQNVEDDDLRQTLEGETLRIARYSDMVLGYVRLKGETTDLVFKDYEIAPIVKNEIKQLRPLIFAKKLSLDLDLTEGARAVTDSRWLGFALGQVLSNSIKYSSPETTIYISANSEKITVRDEGIGISKDDLPRIFEKGYTGYNGRGDKMSTGIGLYLVKKTMDMIGGDIVISSEAGGGTTAELYLTKT